MAALPGQLGIQKPLWISKLMHRWIRQQWEPWASHVCAGVLRKTGCSLPGKPTPIAWRSRLKGGRELRFSKETEVRLAFNCCYGNIPHTVNQLFPGHWCELIKARIPLAVGQSPGSTRISFASRAVSSLAIGREDQVCFQLKRPLLSVHWVTVPGFMLVVHPHGSVRRSCQHCRFSCRAAINLVRVQL